MRQTAPTRGSAAHNFKADPEFAALCPEYLGEDAEGLKWSIVAHGVREPLVVWREERVLLDGHRRLAICREHHFPFKTVE